MKLFKRLTVFVLCMVTLLSIAAISASAAQSYTFTSARKGGNSEEFIITAPNTKKVTVTYNCTAGLIAKNGNQPNEWATTHGANKRYGWYEIQVWGQKANSNTWVKIYTTADNNHKNIKNSEKGTAFTVKGYTKYKVRVYAWKTANFNKTVSSDYGTNSYYYTISELYQNTPYKTYPAITLKWKFS